jgi:hypothetical protein
MGGTEHSISKLYHVTFHKDNIGFQQQKQMQNSYLTTLKNLC